jgi:hypothetical protein
MNGMKIFVELRNEIVKSAVLVVYIIYTKISGKEKA